MRNDINTSLKQNKNHIGAYHLKNNSLKIINYNMRIKLQATGVYRLRQSIISLFTNCAFTKGEMVY